MEKTTFHGEILILSGREAVLIPCLAVIGAVSIIGAGIYGVSTLTKKVLTKVFEEDGES